MKSFFKQFVACVLILTTMLVVSAPVSAAKAEKKRNIAIVFDNSGSMYVKGEKAWCRATYAMEVFASMLNKGDKLYIHPMNPIEVNGKNYTMDSPFVITDSAQASQIRNIHTEKAGDTHIETIDAAINGLKTQGSGENYVIVLTDGQVFYEGGKELSQANTKKKLAERFNSNLGPDLNILYLGIGTSVAMPEIDSEYYVGEKAADSNNVLSVLTMMCNSIFARDTLPSSHISGKTIDFDISLSKLIVFVQGENVSDVKITGKNGAKATLAESAKTHYSENGAANYKKEGQSMVDKSLQGMLVTYTDCSAGKYDISYSGQASNVEVYYEPDADLDFIFTDDEGNLVEPDSLYKGDYKVQFGLKDAKTGELISSDLLGDPVYKGKYVINGKEHTIEHSGQSGETPVSLDVGDTFTAELTATYLSGYSIKKTAKDFGWPDDTLKVAAKPAGDLKLEISGGDSVYNLVELEKGGNYTAKVFYQGNQLTGDELKKVELKWEPEKSNAEIKKEFKDDYYSLSLHYKDPSDPLSTKCGKCTVTIHAFYTPDGSNETSGKSPLTYSIKDMAKPPVLKLDPGQTYFVVSDIDNSKVIKAYVTSNGKKLSPKEFDKLKFEVTTDGLGYKVTPLPEESAYEIKINSQGKLDTGKYNLKATVTQTDSLGRQYTTEESTSLRLGTIPLWLRWLIIIAILALLLFIIWRILHIKVLPKKIHTNKNQCEMNVNGTDVSTTTTFTAKLDGKTLAVSTSYAGNKSVVNMSVQPGEPCFLMTKQVSRVIQVIPESVRAGGSANITSLTIGTNDYQRDEESNKLVPVMEGLKPFNLKNGNIITYSGTMSSDGIDVPFSATIKLLFKK